MIKDIEFYQNLAKKYNKLKTTEEQLKWLRDYQHRVIIYLDNDSTFPIFKDEEGEVIDLDDYSDEIAQTIELNELNDCLGWHNGVQELLKVAGFYSFEEV